MHNARQMRRPSPAKSSLSLAREASVDSLQRHAAGSVRNKSLKSSVEKNASITRMRDKEADENHGDDHEHALSMPEDLEAVAEGLRLRVEIILAKARKPSGQKPQEFKKMKAAVPVQTVQPSKETSTKRLVNDFHNPRSWEGLAHLVLQREDLQNITLEVLYNEFLKADPSYRAALSSELIAAIKGMTNREAIMFLLMQVILAEEKTAREKVPLISSIDRRDRELEEESKKSQFEVASLRNRLKHINEESKKKEETYEQAIAALGKDIAIIKAERSRLQEALTLAVVLQKEETSKLAAERDGATKALAQFKTDFSSTDLKYIDLNAKKIKQLETLLANEKHQSQLLKEGLEEENTKLKEELLACQKQAETFKLELDALSKTSRKATIQRTEGSQLIESESDTIAGMGTVELETLLANEKKEAAIYRMETQEQLSQANSELADLRHRLACMEQEASDTAKKLQAAASSAEAKYAGRCLVLRDENVLLKKQIMWLKGKLNPTQELKKDEVENQEQAGNPSKLLLAQLRSGMKQIEDQRMLEDGFERPGSSIKDEEIDLLKEKCRVLGETVAHLKGESSRQTADREAEHKEAIDQLGAELALAKQQLREERDKRFALERLVGGLSAKSLSQPMACQRCSADVLPPPHDESYFLDLVDAIRKRKLAKTVPPADLQTMARLEKAALQAERRSQHDRG